MRVLRRRAVGELVQVGLPDVRVAGLLKEDDDLGAPRRDVVDEDRRAVGGGQARGIEEIFDGEGDPRPRLFRPGEEDSGRSWAQSTAK
jgi:hypothetical protein